MRTILRSSALRRRACYCLLSGGLLAAALVPLKGASAASCASWVDEAGDATTGQSGVGELGDKNLDIVAAGFGTVGKDVVAVIRTDGLSGGSSDAGDEFRMAFVVAGVNMIMYADRIAPDGFTVSEDAGFLNLDDSDAPLGEATATYDPDAKTVTLKGALTELAAAATKPVAGQKVTGLSAQTADIVLFQPVFEYDDAPTTLTHVLGTSCTLGGATTKPAPSSSASARPSGGASPEPSSSASGSPAPSPSSSGSATPSASASPTGPAPAPQPAVPVPAPGCVGFSDPAGDSDAAVGPAGSGDDADLDLVSVTGRTTATTLSGHLGVTGLASGPSFPVFTGHRFEYEFSVGDKVVVLSATETGPGVGTVDGATNQTLRVDAVFDEPSSQVVLTIDRASLVAALGAALPDGALLDDTAARSYAASPATETIADTASPEDAARATYVIGDNTCFRPALSVSAPASVQTSDLAVVTVAVATSDGRVAPDQAVTARVGSGRAVSARTSKQGTVSLAVPVTEAAGLTDLVVRSAGSAGDGEILTSVQVALERSVLAVRTTGTGNSRTVTAALSDDDTPRRALAGQRVTFTFDGRVLAATTDRAGRAVAEVPAGAVVEVAFAGRSGYLTPAKVRATAG